MIVQFGRQERSAVVFVHAAQLLSEADMQLNLIRQLSGSVVLDDDHLTGLLRMRLKQLRRERVNLPNGDMVRLDSFRFQSAARLVYRSADRAMPTNSRSGSSCGVSACIAFVICRPLIFRSRLSIIFFRFAALSDGRPTSLCSTPVT